MYIGTMVQGKGKLISYKVHNRIKTPPSEWYVVENTHAPIIDKETFEAVQMMHRRDKRAAPQHREVYLLSGFVRCADCGMAMHRNTSHGHVYYICRSYADKGKTSCTQHSVKLEVLEQVVLLTIQKQIELVSTLEEIIRAINNAPSVQTQSNRLTHLLKLRVQELEKVRA